MCLTRRHLLLTGLAGLVGPVCAAAAPALMLARDAPPGLDPAGYLVSEKLDGVRALWDGQVLCFRSGQPIAAPPWFTAGLGPLRLDGELWLARGRFDALSGIVRQLAADSSAWRSVRYQLFDLPGGAAPFVQRATRLQAHALALGQAHVAAVAQGVVGDGPALQRRLAAVVQAGGEGLMLHRADAPWRAGRSDALLKLKPVQDADAVVLGHLPGRGRHTGRMGALRVRTEDGAEFLLGTGFSDQERDAPPALGSLVTFTYRGRTARGMPRFASFLRVRALP